MNNLKPGVSDYYWCCVEIRAAPDVGEQVYLSVTEGVSSVNTVSVQRGGSVTIPCFYDNVYQQHVKYWCRGSDWSSCTPEVRTDYPQISGEVSVKDDPNQQVFTVTINNVKTVDSGDYWCGVEISRGSAVGTRAYLSVTEGVSTLNRVSVHSGGSVTIPCFYDNVYQQHVKYWCRGSDWSSCTPIVHTNSPKKSGEVSIRDDPDRQIFTVTMNNLKTWNSGYYWCGVEISRGSAVGTRVNLSVTEGVSTLNTVTVERGGFVIIPCFYDNIYRQRVKYWCKGSDWSSCTPIVRTNSPKKNGEVSIRDDPGQRLFTVIMNNLTSGDSGSYWCGVEISRGSAVGTQVSLSVTEGVSTLNTVTVQRGGSLTIPCFYDNIYRQHKKYWCKGSDWSSCTPIVRTNYPKKSGEVSIRNDPVKRVFNVTMNNLTTGDSGYYWCGVDISRGSAVGRRVSLSVTGGVSTVNTVTVQRGGSVTIPCFYDNRYKSHVKYWCRGSDWSSCTTIVRTNSPKKNGEVSIRNDPVKPVFNVTMNNLTAGDSGSYWCGVEISRGSAVGTPVSLSVTEGVSTVNRVTVQRGGSVTIPCSYDNMYQQHVKYWCRGSDWSSCTPIIRTNSPKKSGEVSIRNYPVKRVFNVTMNNLTAGDSGYYWCGVEISRGSAVGTPVSLSVTEEGGINEKQSRGQ
nr:polymeric immunoglobulin receptor-like isoform X2 [Paramormyrops kingsleyae]